MIGETEQVFHDGTTKYLISPHALGTLSASELFTLVQILLDPLEDGRIVIDDVNGDFQRLVLRMVFDLRHQR